MNEKFNKNAKVEELTKVDLGHGEEKGLIVKDPFTNVAHFFLCTYIEVQTFVSYADCLMTSGAIQKGVPTNVFLLFVVFVS